MSTFRRKGAVDGVIYDLGSAGQAAYPRSFLDALLALGGSSPQSTDATVSQRQVSSASAYPARSGTWRLATGDTIDWRNAANSGDLALGRDAFNGLTWTALPLSRNPLADASVTTANPWAGGSVPNNALTPLLVRPTRIDTRAALAGAVFTAPVTGYYAAALVLNLNYGPVAAGNRVKATLDLVGTGSLQIIGETSNGGDLPATISAVFLFNATAGQQFTVSAFQDSGLSQNPIIPTRLAWVRLWGTP